jgi:hypothetical protein
MIRIPIPPLRNRNYTLLNCLCKYNPLFKPRLQYCLLSRIASPFLWKSIPTLLRVILPIHVFRELAGKCFPIGLRFASQLHLMHYQGIEHSQFATNRKAPGENGRASFVARSKQFPACPKEIRKGRRRWIQFVHRFQCHAFESNVE